MSFRLILSIWDESFPMFHFFSRRLKRVEHVTIFLVLRSTNELTVMPGRYNGKVGSQKGRVLNMLKQAT